MIHKTDPDEAGVHGAGWYVLPGGDVEITRLPVIDTAHQLDNGEYVFARLTYEDALKVAERLGGRLLTAEEVAALGTIGLQLHPYLGTPTAEKTIHHSKLHDADVWRQLAERDWDFELPVAGAGKHWIDGAPPGKSRLMGWDKDGPGPGKALWQRPAVAHNRQHHDDGTTTLIARERRVTPITKRSTPGAMRAVQIPPAPPTPSDTQPAPPWHFGIELADYNIGERCLMWMGFQSGLGITEKPGIQHDERIVEYSRHCRRGGDFLGVDGGRRPIWRGGIALPLTRDEDPWCAAITSAALLEALLIGEHPPHGLRVSVRELVSDARKAGTFRPPEWTPLPGSLAIEARRVRRGDKYVLGDPTRGGNGHVRRVVLVEEKRYSGLGGNENNRIMVAWHPVRAHLLRGWIDCS